MSFLKADLFILVQWVDYLIIITTLVIINNMKTKRNVGEKIRKFVHRKQKNGIF